MLPSVFGKRNANFDFNGFSDQMARPCAHAESASKNPFGFAIQMIPATRWGFENPIHMYSTVIHTKNLRQYPHVALRLQYLPPPAVLLTGSYLVDLR